MHDTARNGTRVLIDAAQKDRALSRSLSRSRMDRARLFACLRWQVREPALPRLSPVFEPMPVPVVETAPRPWQLVLQCILKRVLQFKSAPSSDCPWVRFVRLLSGRTLHGAGHAGCAPPTASPGRPAPAPAERRRKMMTSHNEVTLKPRTSGDCMPLGPQAVPGRARGPAHSSSGRTRPAHLPKPASTRMEPRAKKPLVSECTVLSRSISLKRR